MPRDLFHSKQRARTRQIRGVRDRLFACVGANQPPSSVDLLQASMYCARVEMGGDQVEGTLLASLYWQLATILPAAERIYARDQALNGPSPA